MFGQWAIGSSPIGEPEELAGGMPLPAEARVWFDVQPDADIFISITPVTEDVG